ncbi:MAG TPA: type II secretion system secretin GspD [Kofleriaceae bacterium]|nr:type II secretion system secretin GspD [Kofleriaceae bacterium]
MQKARRSLIATIVFTGVTSVLAGLVPSPGGWSTPVASAQPAGAPAERTVSTTPATPAPGEDEALYSCKKRTGQVAVTFKPETELKDLITWVMGFTCKNFILDPRIVSTGKKVTVIAPNKMSSTEAYRVFLVALSTMGLTIVPKGNVIRIVDSAAAKGETVPIFKRGIPNDEDQIVRYVLRPTYAQVETLRQALDSIRSPAGNVQIAGTMLIITDYASQVRDMMSLARSIDVPGGSDGIYTIPVHHADATQLAQKLNEILGITGGGGVAQVPGGIPQPGGGRRGGAPQPVPVPPGQPAPPIQNSTDDVSSAVPSKILVDDRSNTLIVVSSEAGYYRVKGLVDRLDIALDTEGGSAIHVFPLENALAEELATTLNNAMGQSTPQRPGQTGGRPGQPGAPGVPQPQPQPQPIPGGPDNLGAALEGQVRVIGDKPTNSLIVMSTGRDFIAIKDVVRRLDHPRRQVFIEALILEVQLAKELDIGSSSHGGFPVGSGDSNALVIGGVQTPNLRSISAAASLASATGLIGGLIGTPLKNSQTFLGTSIPSYGILFQALATQDNTDVLSAPHIIAIDNEKTEFSVGNNIPYKAGLTFGGFGLPGAAGASQIPTGSIGQNIQRQDLNLTLNVTPHISSNDVVRIEIEQETKDIGGKDAELGPTWTQRKLKTQVVVHDQQSVVIGGLIQERDVYNVSKVPLLGDIPILGYLFKFSTKAKKKTNLLILLTPYIVKDQLDLQSIRERKVRERDEFVESFATLNEMKYEPKVDYRRKRGVIEEINRSIQAVEDDVAAANAIGRRRWVDPGPIEYGPSQIEAPEEGHGDGTTAPQPDGKPKKVDPKKPEPKAKVPVKRSEVKAPASKQPVTKPSDAPSDAATKPSDAAASKPSADAKSSDATGAKPSDTKSSDAKPDAKADGSKPEARRKGQSPRKYTPGRKSQAELKAEAKARAKAKGSGAMPWDDAIDASAAPQAAQKKAKKGTR